MALIGLLFTLVAPILFTFAILIFSIVFWVMMLVDCVQRKFKKDSEKIMWVIILFTGIVGALIYFFLVKNKSKTKKSKKK